MTRRTTLILSTLFAAPIAFCFHSLRKTPPVDGAFVGLTETAVRSQLGLPRLEFAGHYGNPAAAATRPFIRQIKTSVFAIFGGDEYVTFEKRGGVWFAIFNNWLANGAAF